MSLPASQLGDVERTPARRAQANALNSCRHRGEVGRVTDAERAVALRSIDTASHLCRRCAWKRPLEPTVLRAGRQCLSPTVVLADILVMNRFGPILE